ncbi:inositol monophosphatase family protein [Aeromicrobium sp. Root495]|uniref:inositol monophosphatase family protein n=1 Tax=Aeromicrobium sp. Root495 TaxID=1736550 RepID=UPI000AD2DD58|nr:inositol monophosphatase family protein [Aeromicrobium sp. Root495]
MDDAALAAHLVTEAAALAARMRDEGLDVSRKTSVSDLVTDADKAAEAFVVETLQRERPDDGLLGEEGTAEEGRSGRRWVIDPVDGTYNFAHRLHHWCSALALQDGEDVVLGAVAHHADQRVLVGGPDLPTTSNGEVLPRLEDRELGQVGAATYLHPGWVGEDAVRTPWLRAATGPATLRTFGSGSMEMVDVALGRLGLWYQHSTPAWDWLPGCALLLGVGGSATSVEVDGYRWYVAGRPSAVGGAVDLLAGS